MIQSMTGFGKAETMQDGKSIKVEVRSLNSKFFDLNLRLSSSLRNKENEIRILLTEKLQRGKVDVSISMGNGEESKVSINKEVAKKYFSELKSLAKELGTKKSDLLPIIMQIPEVMTSAKSDLSDNEWKVILETLDAAINDMLQFRNREGLQLETALREHVTQLYDLLIEAEQFEGERREMIRTRLQTQLHELISKDGYDKNRFEQELIYYIERLDFTEEKVRLRSHCDFFLKTLEDKTSNGRRLAFISQEMGREINTLGSKANHAAIQKFIVQMKDDLEKIKEQLLNVL
ncbi:MAG: YicC family protein [Chitinophagales bacterium]|nr:YicC family protein [Chitinophagales bacterium]